VENDHIHSGAVRRYRRVMAQDRIGIFFDSRSIKVHALIFDGREAAWQMRGAPLTQFPALSDYWLQAGNQWRACSLKGVAQFQIGEGPVFSLSENSLLQFRDLNGRFDGHLESLDTDFAHYRDGNWRYDARNADGSLPPSAVRLTIATPAFFASVAGTPTDIWIPPGPPLRPSSLAERRG